MTPTAPKPKGMMRRYSAAEAATAGSSVKRAAIQPAANHSGTASASPARAQKISDSRTPSATRSIRPAPAFCAAKGLAMADRAKNAVIASASVRLPRAKPATAAGPCAASIAV